MRSNKGAVVEESPMKQKFMNWLASVFSNYVMPDYEAHRRAAEAAFNAEVLSLRIQYRDEKQKREKAEAHVDMFKEITDKLIKEAFNVPDGEMTPFVHQAVVELENGMRYVK